MATVRIPPVLRPKTGGQPQVEADGSTVGEVLRALTAEHADTESQLFGEDGELNRYVNVYLNDEDVRVLDGPRHRGRRRRHRRHPAGDGRRRASSASALEDQSEEFLRPLLPGVVEHVGGRALLDDRRRRP